MIRLFFFFTFTCAHSKTWFDICLRVAQIFDFAVLVDECRRAWASVENIGSVTGSYLYTIAMFGKSGRVERAVGTYSHCLRGKAGRDMHILILSRPHTKYRHIKKGQLNIFYWGVSAWNVNNLDVQSVVLFIIDFWRIDDLLAGKYDLMMRFIFCKNRHITAFLKLSSNLF